MWYFAWMLGVSMAVLLAIVNTMVCETHDTKDGGDGSPPRE